MISHAWGQNERKDYMYRSHALFLIFHVQCAYGANVVALLDENWAVATAGLYYNICLTKETCFGFFKPSQPVKLLNNATETQ